MDVFTDSSTAVPAVVGTLITSAHLVDDAFFPDLSTTVTPESSLLPQLLSRYGWSHCWEMAASLALVSQFTET